MRAVIGTRLRIALVRRGTDTHPDFFRPALAKLEKLDESVLRRLVNRVPDDWMTPSAREFASALLCYSFGRLGRHKPACGSR